MTDQNSSTISDLYSQLTWLQRQHRKTYEEMICIENEMDDIRSQLKAAGEEAFADEP